MIRSNRHNDSSKERRPVMKIAVANAPIFDGALDLTVGIDPNVPNGEQILNEVRDAGYAGIDLGPVGYLGDGPVLAERLASRQLGLARAYLEFPFTDLDALPSLYPELDAMLDTFDAVRSVVPGPVPHPTIADSGSERRRNNPGRSHADHSWGLDDDGWDRMKAGLASVVARCRDRGYEPTFHHETGTYVEAPWEIQRILDISDVGLCLDTGHFFIDGGDNMDNGSNSTLNVYPSVDAIAEFKVLTSNYGAQYGRNGSGTIETVTKSGGKDFHGDAYEFVRNNDF